MAGEPDLGTAALEDGMEEAERMVWYPWRIFVSALYVPKEIIRS